MAVKKTTNKTVESEEIIQTENTVNEGNETDDEEKDIVVDINYRLNEVSVYDDSTTKTSTVTVNNGSSRRRLEQQNYQTTINGKYLLNVYKIDVSDENKIYYAYAILLELSKKTGKNEEKMGGSDVRNPDNSDFPFIKFSFDSKGNILKFEVAENYDKVLISYNQEFEFSVVLKRCLFHFSELLQNQLLIKEILLILIMKIILKKKLQVII